MIQTTSLISLFRTALSEHWGYIWGTAGEKWTALKQSALEKTTDPDRAQGRKYGARWVGHTVADCSGLFSWAFKQLGGYMYHGSDTMYRKYCADKGELKKGTRTDGGTLKPGTAVFVWNGKKYSPVGLYVGDGTVIEAMGTLKGVTTTKVTATKWTHWGELAGVDYAHAGTVPSPVVIPTGAEGGAEESPPSRPTVRRGSRGQAVKDCQVILDSLGYDTGPCGTDGIFGRCTEAAVKAFQKDRNITVDGIVGKQTWKELMK